MSKKNETIKALIKSGNYEDIEIGIQVLLTQNYNLHTFKQFMKMGFTSKSMGVVRKIYIVNDKFMYTIRDKGISADPITYLKYHKSHSVIFPGTPIPEIEYLTIKKQL